MSAWRDYVAWSGLDEAMASHPAGKGIPESPEVAQARMDAEAVMLANSRHKRSRVPDWLAGLLLGLFVYGVLAVVGLAGAMVAGWPL